MKHLGLVALVMTAACGGDSGTDGVAIDALDEAVAEAFCTKLFACCNADEEAQFGAILGFTDEASCKTSYQMDYDDELVEIRARVASGELTYDGAAAGACVADLDAATCTQFLTPVGQTACDVIFVGKLDNGQTCTDDESCSSGYCEGTCLAVPTSGQPCEGLCAAGLTCAAGTCITPKADGAACTQSSECASGDCDATCQPVTTCDGAD